MNIPQEPTQEQELLTAKIFADGADHPIYLLYQRIFKQALNAHYYKLAHLPPTDSLDKKLQKVEKLSGRIAELEALLEIPKNYSEYAENAKEEENNADKSTI